MPPSMATHSCSGVYRNPSGTAVMTGASPVMISSGPVVERQLSVVGLLSLAAYIHGEAGLAIVRLPGRVRRNVRHSDGPAEGRRRRAARHRADCAAAQQYRIAVPGYPPCLSDEPHERA